MEPNTNPVSTIGQLIDSICHWISAYIQMNCEPENTDRIEQDCTFKTEIMNMGIMVFAKLAGWTPDSEHTQVCHALSFLQTRFRIPLELSTFYPLIQIALKQYSYLNTVDHAFDRNLECLKALNLAYSEYLYQLKLFDIPALEAEIRHSENANQILCRAANDEEERLALDKIIQIYQIQLPWAESHDNFDSFMRDHAAVMRFK